MPQLPQWETTDRRTTACRALATYVLGPGHEQLHAIAGELAARWDLPRHEVAVWLADLLGEGADVLRNWVAGEAEAHGLPILTIAAALGQASTSNGRRRTPHARRFSEARRAVDLTGTSVFVDVSTWPIHVVSRD